MIEELLMAAKLAELHEAILHGWKQKGMDFVAKCDALDDDKSIEQVYNLCVEAAKAELDIYISTFNKLKALAELQLIKNMQKENNPDVKMH